ncbi:MAG: LptA/OstA family protein [Atribacterota bacterium]|nr:LptA/OstA family protein [Atribacterota bacterium]
MAEEKGQSPAVVIRTPSAEYDEKSGKITAQNSTVEWQGIRVTCPFIEVNTKAQEVRSNGDIGITWENFTARAQSLFYRRADNVLIMDNVSGGNAELHFTAQKMNLDFVQEVIRLSAAPYFQTKDLVLRAQEVEYSLKEKIWQARKVNLERGEWKGKAERAFYSSAEKYVILEGQAEVFRGENILRGERIRLDLGTGQVKVEGDVEINIFP